VERSSSTYVTQVFVDRVNQHALQGFHFIKLWPLPKGVSWREEDRRNRSKESLVETKEGRKPVKGNTVVLLLPIAEARPSKKEKERLAKLMDEVDALLHNPAGNRNAPCVGNLEGNDDFNGECRLFLSCPDAD